MSYHVLFQGVASSTVTCVGGLRFLERACRGHCHDRRGCGENRAYDEWRACAVFVATRISQEGENESAGMHQLSERLQLRRPEGALRTLPRLCRQVFKEIRFAGGRLA